MRYMPNDKKPLIDLTAPEPDAVLEKIEGIERMVMTLLMECINGKA